MVAPSFESHQCLTGMWKRRLSYHAGHQEVSSVTPEVNLRECVTPLPLPSSNKAAHSGFETQRRHHQKFETGVSVAPKMDMCPTKKKIIVKCTNNVAPVGLKYSGPTGRFLKPKRS